MLSPDTEDPRDIQETVSVPCLHDIHVGEVRHEDWESLSGLLRDKSARAEKDEIQTGKIYQASNRLM